MVGRGCYGRPWFLRQVIDYLRTGERLPDPPLARATTRSCCEHYEEMLTPLWHRGRPAHRAQASRLVLEGPARLGRVPRRGQPDRRRPRRQGAGARLLRAADRARDAAPDHAPRGEGRSRADSLPGSSGRSVAAEPDRAELEAAVLLAALPDRGARRSIAAARHRALRQPGRRAVLRRQRRRADRQ